MPWFRLPTGYEGRYVRDEFLSGAPDAIATAKALIPRVWTRGASDAAGLTAEAIAAQRVSKEGQEGLRAFLEKREAVGRLAQADASPIGARLPSASSAPVENWHSPQLRSTRMPMRTP